MVQGIVWDNGYGGVALYGANTQGYPYIPLVLFGMKDAPAGVPFWIVNDADLPHNIPFDAWTLDLLALGEPDGYGGNPQPFFDAIAAHEAEKEGQRQPVDGGMND